MTREQELCILKLCPENNSIENDLAYTEIMPLCLHGTPLAYGITRLGFPFLLFKLAGYLHLDVGISRYGNIPKSFHRCESNNKINLHGSMQDILDAAHLMSQEVI